MTGPDVFILLVGIVAAYGIGVVIIDDPPAVELRKRLRLARRLHAEYPREGWWQAIRMAWMIRRFACDPMNQGMTVGEWLEVVEAIEIAERGAFEADVLADIESLPEIA